MFDALRTSYSNVLSIAAIMLTCQPHHTVGLCISSVDVSAKWLFYGVCMHGTPLLNHADDNSAAGMIDPGNVVYITVDPKHLS